LVLAEQSTSVKKATSKAGYISPPKNQRQKDLNPTSPSVPVLASVCDLGFCHPFCRLALFAARRLLKQTGRSTKLVGFSGAIRSLEWSKATTPPHSSTVKHFFNCPE
jgi:hypothetical protein